MSSHLKEQLENAVAVIGMHGAFPGAKAPADFWRLLAEGREALTLFSDAELLAAGVPASQLQDPRYVKAGMVLEDIDLFDAAFFGVNPREAELMDPQLRLLLECAWTAFENAGYDPGRFTGKVGVFTGAASSRYYFNNLLLNKDIVRIAGGALSTLTQWNDRDSVSTLISYKLDLRGPSVTVQSACSTALVAAHLACQSLLNGETDLALAGGVSIAVPQRSGHLYQEGMILSPDGHCRPFDARAKGTLFGSGFGLVVLRRLEDALEDGDRILAVIRGSAVNNDGALKAGYTAPSVVGQADAISEALSLAQIEPETITYVEAHGTGTELGDPIEVEALTKAFGLPVGAGPRCALGSVKSNIGHLDRAAGVASLIKVVLALQHRQLPPSLNFGAPNPKIDFSRTPFFVNTCLSDWQPKGFPRRAGVSAMGIGGTNAHLVLEEAPAARASDPARKWQLLPVSARSETALERAAVQLAEHLQAKPREPLADIAWTLQEGRRHFRHRSFVVAHENDSAARDLLLPATREAAEAEDQGHPLVFLFSGQGAQYAGMARELYDEERTFKDIIDAGCSLIQRSSGLNLMASLYPATPGTDDLSRTELAQPALFLVEYALARLWISWGFEPSAMLGHSLGEYVAACLAEVFSFEEALTLVAARGRLMGGLPTGAMLSLACDAAEALKQLAVMPGGNEVAIAAVNAPGLCTVSGPTARIEALEQHLKSGGLSPQRLHTSHAFHSSMMDGMMEDFRSVFRRMRPKAPSRRWISNRTGTWIRPEEAVDVEYWVKHLRERVEFSPGVQTLRAERRWTWLEVGPGRTLAQLVRRHFKPQDCDPIHTSLPHARDTVPAARHIRVALGRLWMAGHQIHWRGLHADERRHRVELPTYPFERERYWVEPSRRDGSASGSSAGAQLARKNQVDDWFYQTSWSQLPPDAPASANRLTAGEVWWVLAGAGPLGAALAGKLASGGATAVWVRPGSRLHQVGSNEWEVDPTSAEGCRQFVHEMQAAGLKPSRIVHLWSLGAGAGVADTMARFEIAQQLGCCSVVMLVQGLVAEFPGQSLRMDVISDGIFDVLGDEPLDPNKATLTGPCRVVSQECPGVFLTLSDILLKHSEEADTCAAALLAGLLQAAAEPWVAYRGQRRWVPSHRPVRLDQTSAADLPLRQGGVYLITGGFGEIGFTIASWLAREWKAKIFLLGRSTVSVDPGRSDGEGGRAARLQHLAQIGAEVWPIQTDVGDEPLMKKAIDDIIAKYGVLDGVFHAAGILTGTPVLQVTAAQFAAHFRAKANGLMVLQRVLADRPATLVVAISSLSAVLGGLGTVAYAAANGFMDVFVTKLRREGWAQWQSLQWDSWDFGDPRTPLLCLSPAEGLEALGRGLGACSWLGVVAVSVANLPARVERWVSRGGAIKGDEPPAVKLYARPKSSRPFVAPASELEKQLAAVWMELLGVESVGANDDFFELGGHSLMATQVISRIRDLFGVELPLRALFDASTLADLARRVELGRWTDPKQAAAERDGGGREEIEL